MRKPYHSSIPIGLIQFFRLSLHDVVLIRFDLLLIFSIPYSGSFLRDEVHLLSGRIWAKGVM